MSIVGFLWGKVRGTEPKPEPAPKMWEPESVGEVYARLARDRFVPLSRVDRGAHNEFLRGFREGI